MDTLIYGIFETLFICFIIYLLYFFLKNSGYLEMINNKLDRYFIKEKGYREIKKCFCRKCGEELNETAFYCRKCGTKVEK